MNIIKFKPKTKFWMVEGVYSGQTKYACRTKYYIRSDKTVTKDKTITYSPKDDIITFAGSVNGYRYLSEESISLKEMIQNFPEIEKYIDE